MKIRSLSDSKGNLVAVLGGGAPAEVHLKFRPTKDQFMHEVELPPEADKLEPREILRRLKIASPGQSPTFS